MRLRSLVSLRWSVAVVVVLVVIAAGSAAWPPAPREVQAAPGPVPVEVAVRRTLAAGTARIDAIVRSADSASGAVTVTGVTSFADARGEYTARSRAGDEITVRTTPEGTSLRVGAADQPWTPIDPATTDLVASAKGWDGLLRGLHGHTTADGRPITYASDRAGHLIHLHVDDAGGASLDLRLSQFGAPVP